VNSFNFGTLNNILKKKKDEKLKLHSRNNTLLSSSASAQVSVNLNIEQSHLGTIMNLGNNEYSNIEYYYYRTLSVIMM
jgi:hypothetical protein